MERKPSVLDPIVFELDACDSCAAEKGTGPKRLWFVWVLSWVFLITGIVLTVAIGQHSRIPLMFIAPGLYVMPFATILLIIMSSLGGGWKFILCLLALTPLGLFIVPMLGGDINHNKKILTVLQPIALDRIQNWKESTALDQYRAAVRYLENCGTLDERKLREFNLMTGSRLSEQEVFQLVHNALPAPDGPAMVREELLNVAKEAVADLENQKEQGADPSRYQA